MNESTTNYSISKLPELRLWVLELLAKAKKTSPIQTLLEIDVTHPLKLIEEHEKATGEKISFNAYMMRCIARVVAEYPELNSYRLGRRKLITFKSVDIANAIEYKVDGKKIPAVYVLRSAEKKSIREIQDEIQRAKKLSPEQESSRNRAMSFVKMLPGGVQRLIWRITMRDPRVRQRLEGTIVMSNLLKISSQVAAVSLAPSGATASFVICSLRKQPWVVDDQVVARQILRLSCAFDHAVVDGGPLGRAGMRLVELMESGFELPVH